MPDNDKQQLYREIIQQTDDETLLEEMRLHGFWPDNEGLPQDPPQEMDERNTIEAELERLRKSSFPVHNWKKELENERRRRWEESKKRRAERKKERELEKQRRNAQWQRLKEETIVHAGEGVSGGLQQATSDADALSRRGLPVLHSGAELASAMGISLPVLRWLTYHRKGAAIVHYHRYTIAKKTGGVRCISAPKPALAHAQRWIFDNILKHLQVEPSAHGFIAGRSIITNAQPHAGQPVVINLDVKDFFPSITFRRVKGLFHRIGYSEHVATVLALLCTEPPRIAAEVDGKVYYVALGARILPQGACTSPAITNVLCRRLDQRLNGLARKHGFNYTRYADDLTFSGDQPRAVGRLLRSVRSILDAEGFAEHPTKTRIMHHARRQEVTGLTVNHRPTVPRDEVRRLRAILYNAAKHGLENQNRDGRDNFIAYLRGRVAYICMVDGKKGAKLKDMLARVLAQSQ